MTARAAAVELASTLRQRWLAMIVVGLLAIVWAWSIATPPGGGVDEPDHVIRAAAAVRGDFAGTRVVSDLGEAARHYDVPLSIEGPDLVCWTRKPEVSAACATWPVGTSSRLGVLNSYYPPEYFLLTGWPTWFTTRYAIVRVMRLLSGLLAIGFVGIGLFTVKRMWGRPAVAVTLMALTPGALSLMGVVNPQALEVGAAFCLWATAVAVLGVSPPTRLQSWAFAAAGITMCLTRPLGSLFAALILCAVAVTLGLRVAVAALRRKEVLLVVAVGLVTAAVMATHGVSSLDAPALATRISLGSTLKQTLGNSLNDLRDAVTLTGWLDTRLPSLATLFWLAAMGAVLVGLFAARAHRQLIAVAFVAAAFLAMQTWILYTQTNSNGLRWQGRYGLAIYMGLPFVFLSRRPQVRARTLQVLVVVFAALQWISLYWGLRRWTVGTDGPFLYPFREDWIPPVPSVFILAVAAIGAWLIVAGVRACLAQVDHEG